MARKRSSPARSPRAKSQRLAKLDPQGLSQSGVLPTPAPAGKSPPANQGRQERAAAAGKKPSILAGIGKFIDVFFTGGK